MPRVAPSQQDGRERGRGGEGGVDAELLEFGGHFGGEDGSGRGAVDADMAGLVGLQELLVDRD